MHKNDWWGGRNENWQSFIQSLFQGIVLRIIFVKRRSMTFNDPMFFDQINASVFIRHQSWLWLMYLFGLATYLLYTNLVWPTDTLGFNSQTQFGFSFICYLFRVSMWIWGTGIQYKPQWCFMNHHCVNVIHVKYSISCSICAMTWFV